MDGWSGISLEPFNWIRSHVRHWTQPPTGRTHFTLSPALAVPVARRPCRKVKFTRHPQIKLKRKQTKQNWKRQTNRKMFSIHKRLRGRGEPNSSRSTDWWGTRCRRARGYLCEWSMYVLGYLGEHNSTVCKKKTKAQNIKSLCFVLFFFYHLLFIIIYNYHLRVSRWLRPKVFNTLHQRHNNIFHFLNSWTGPKKKTKKKQQKKSAFEVFLKPLTSVKMAATLPQGRRRRSRKVVEEKSQCGGKKKKTFQFDLYPNRRDAFEPEGGVVTRKKSREHS